MCYGGSLYGFHCIVLIGEVDFTVTHFYCRQVLSKFVYYFSWTMWLISTSLLYCGEPEISLHSYTVPLVQWSTRLLPVMRDPGSIPSGVLMWNRDFPVSIVLLHWWPWHDWSLWPRLRQSSSLTITRLSYWQCDNPTWSHTALLSQFHTPCRSSFRLHNNIVPNHH